MDCRSRAANVDAIFEFIITALGSRHHASSLASLREAPMRIHAKSSRGASGARSKRRLKP
jgi:hypothetical protein